LNLSYAIDVLLLDIVPINHILTCYNGLVTIPKKRTGGISEPAESPMMVEWLKGSATLGF